jgi:hypothetical protein
MKSPLIRDIEAWEAEGGAALAPLDVSVALMSGTAAQVEWAERIKAQVAFEFDRVTASFRSIATKESADKRAGTERLSPWLRSLMAHILGQF